VRIRVPDTSAFLSRQGYSIAFHRNWLIRIMTRGVQFLWDVEMIERARDYSPMMTI
jgi:hypothetical protein